jgi:hypothetical protein
MPVNTSFPHKNVLVQNIIQGIDKKNSLKILLKLVTEKETRDIIKSVGLGQTHPESLRNFIL